MRTVECDFNMVEDDGLVPTEPNLPLYETVRLQQFGEPDTYQYGIVERSDNKASYVRVFFR